MNKIIKNAMIAGFALAAALTFSVSAFAIDNEADCKQQITDTTRVLLKKTVTDDQLVQIDSKLSEAGGKCSSGDFAAAETLINEANAILDSVGN